MVPAFAVVSLDMFGPYKARRMGGGSRKMFKVWGLLYSCLSTKVVAIWACPGYDTGNFVTTHRKHTSIYGEPRLVISDQGSQITAGAKEMVDWDYITFMTAKSGTKWKFTEVGCSWRNGQAERAIGLAKKTLEHQLGSHLSLDFAQLDSLFAKVSSIMNSRPLGARSFTEENFYPVCPRDLLLGRAAGGTHDPSQESLLDQNSGHEADLTKHQSQIEEVVAMWWNEWIKIAFPLFLPRSKWCRKNRNLMEGDIVHLKYSKKFGDEKYRLARVLAIHPDLHGVVRTVTVGVRDRRGKKNEQWDQCGSKLAELVVGVQRLVVVLPVEEQHLPEKREDELEDVETPVPESVVRTEEVGRRQSRRIRKMQPIFEEPRWRHPGVRIPSPGPVGEDAHERGGEVHGEMFGIGDIKDLVESIELSDY